MIQNKSSMECSKTGYMPHKRRKGREIVKGKQLEKKRRQTATKMAANIIHLGSHVECLALAKCQSKLSYRRHSKEKLSLNQRKAPDRKLYLNRTQSDRIVGIREPSCEKSSSIRNFFSASKLKLKCNWNNRKEDHRRSSSSLGFCLAALLLLYLRIRGIMVRTNAKILSQMN